MPKFKALEPLLHDGKKYAPGSIAELDQESASELLAIGAISAEIPPPPEPEGQQKKEGAVESEIAEVAPAASAAPQGLDETNDEAAAKAANKEDSGQASSETATETGAVDGDGAAAKEGKPKSKKQPKE